MLTTMEKIVLSWATTLDPVDNTIYNIIYCISSRFFLKEESV